MRSAEVQVALERNSAHVAMKAQLTTFLLRLVSMNLVFKVLLSVKTEVIILFFLKNELQVPRIKDETAYNCS